MRFCLTQKPDDPVNGCRTAGGLVEPQPESGTRVCPPSGHFAGKWSRDELRKAEGFGFVFFALRAWYSDCKEFVNI